MKPWSWKVDPESSLSLLLGAVKSLKTEIREHSWSMESNRRAQAPVLNLQPAGSALPDGYFWGRPTKPRPRQKALIKSSSRGGWKVGYQHHCRSSVRPARLHLLNTSGPSPSQTWPRLPKTTPWRNELIPYSSYSSVNIYFIRVIFSTRIALLCRAISTLLPALWMRSRNRGVRGFEHIMGEPPG